MPLLLNLSPYDPRRIRIFRQALTATALLLLLLLSLQILAAWRLIGGGRREGGRIAHMTREMEQLERRLGELRDGLTEEDRKTLATRITFFNRLLEASVFSWTGLLAELENAIPSQVYLADIEPDLATGKVRVHGVAATLEGLTAFVRHLQERAAFRDVFLLRQAEKTGASPGAVTGVEFQISLVYGRST